MNQVPEDKRAELDHPIHDVLAQRWSPAGFDPDRPVTAATLASLFEAARWAASSYNEQPWRYIVARRVEDAAGFERMLACLAPGNQSWAANAPVLALGLLKRRLDKTGAPNRAAAHDLGAASASLTLEATSRGLYVHQMIGIDPEVARQTYGIPESFEALTALAIGHRLPSERLDQSLAIRDSRPRERRALSDLVFAGTFAVPAGLE